MVHAPTLRRLGGPYAMSMALVFLGFAARTALTPAFGVNHAYTTFYPVVTLAAYFLEAGPASLAALLSTGLGYWFFAAPERALKDDFTTLASMMFFGMHRQRRDLLHHRHEARARREAGGRAGAGGGPGPVPRRACSAS